MADHGYINFYTPPEYESYQQYQQHSYEDERYSVIENTLNVFMQQSMINMQDTNQRLKNLSLQIELIQAQIMDNQANNQSTLGEQENNPNMFERFREIVEEVVVQNEEVTTLEECGAPHKEELPQERSNMEVVKTVDIEEVMVVEKKERLLIKEDLMEVRGKKVNKVEIDRVIDEICALFNKPKSRRTWTPSPLFLKFMEFLPKRRVSKDDVLSVSFWPP
jgi:hypothetical protein